MVDLDGAGDLFLEESLGEGEEADSDEFVEFGRLREVSDLEHDGVSLDLISVEDEEVVPLRVEFAVDVDGGAKFVVSESDDYHGLHGGEPSGDVSLESGGDDFDHELAGGVRGENFWVVFAAFFEFESDREMDHAHLFASAVDVALLVELEVSALSDFRERETTFSDQGIFEEILVPDFDVNVVVLVGSLEVEIFVPLGELSGVDLHGRLLKLSAESQFDVGVLFSEPFDIFMEGGLFEID